MTTESDIEAVKRLVGKKREIEQALAELAGIGSSRPTKEAPGERVPVLVCTGKRGVFFGYAKDPKADPIELESARMAVYWSSDVRGVVGLAGRGPTPGCRISGPADGVFVGVTAVFRVTPEAVRAWEAAPWSK